MTQDPGSSPQGVLRRAVIREGAAVFTLFPPFGAEEICAEILEADDTRRRVEFDTPEAGDDGTLIYRLPMDPEGPAVREVTPLIRIGAEWHKPERDDTTCFVHRLLSTDLEQINTNLRWKNRIDDLETRFFATRNSLKLIGDDANLRGRCVVSVGYQAIEQDNDIILNWCAEDIAECGADLGTFPDPEVRMSMATFWVHLAIFREDITMLGALSRSVRESVFPSDFPAIATYNALCLALLLAGWHLARGDFEEACALLQPTDKFFKLAAYEYPRALVNYREMIGLAERTYYCQIGLRMAKNLEIPDGMGIPSLGPGIAWKKGNRLRGDSAQKRAGEKYETLCAACESGAHV